MLTVITQWRGCYYENHNLQWNTHTTTSALNVLGSATKHTNWIQQHWYGIKRDNSLIIPNCYNLYVTYVHYFCSCFQLTATPHSHTGCEQNVSWKQGLELVSFSYVYILYWHSTPNICIHTYCIIYLCEEVLLVALTDWLHTQQTPPPCME